MKPPGVASAFLGKCVSLTIITILEFLGYSSPAEDRLKFLLFYYLFYHCKIEFVCVSTVSLHPVPQAPIITKVSSTAGMSFGVKWKSGDGNDISNIDASISPNDLTCTRNGPSYTCQYNQTGNLGNYVLTVSSYSCRNQLRNETPITFNLGMSLANVTC